VFRERGTKDQVRNLLVAGEPRAVLYNEYQQQKNKIESIIKRQSGRWKTDLTQEPETTKDEERKTHENVNNGEGTECSEKYRRREKGPMHRKGMPET